MSFLACFGHISIKIMLKMNRERRINCEKLSFGAYTNHRSAAVRGGGGGAPRDPQGGA